MRIQLIVAAVVLGAAALFGCKGDDSKSEPIVSAEQSEELNASEDALLGKRDALFNMRRDIQSKREALDKERVLIREQGGDTSEVDAKARALLDEEKALSTRENSLNRAMEDFSKGRREIIAAVSGAGGAAAGVSGREAGVASREKDLARRERDLAAREASLSRREEGLATKWKDECAAGGGLTQTIIRTVDAKGSSYTQKDVEPLLSKARREMGKKGLLMSDLPQQARGLEAEANTGMKNGDFGRARLAASQLLGTVRNIKINKAFISAKIQRLNARMRGKTLSKKAEGLFREATSLYGDAKFSQSNSKLNKIAASL
jgi:outer membrane murein-binding lipoprotein Lpp